MGRFVRWQILTYCEGGKHSSDKVIAVVMPSEGLVLGGSARKVAVVEYFGQRHSRRQENRCEA